MKDRQILGIYQKTNKQLRHSPTDAAPQFFQKLTPFKHSW